VVGLDGVVFCAVDGGYWHGAAGMGPLAVGR
jgi:hypothetical protein